jgi:hypothetical protein
MDPTKSPPEGAVNFGGKMGEFDSMPKMDLGSHFLFLPNFHHLVTKKLEFFVFLV